MSLEDEPRRGTRERKQPQRFAPPLNGKANASDSESEEDRPRKVRKPGKPRAPARKKKTPEGDLPRHVQPADGFKTDSGLFNAIITPDTALQPLVEDWVHNYQGTAGNEDKERAAVHELVLFIVRACGLSADVDENEAMDQDGVVDAIERIQDESVKTNTATYPLISKDKRLRSFKGNLTTVVAHLIATLYLTPILYEDADSTKHSVPLMPLLLSWLLSMSSSPLRPIRHTATFVALKINSALCESAAAVSKELSIKQRQREAEAKKAGSNAAAKKRHEDAEQKVKETHERKTKLEEYMQEIFNVMFVHRVRDADPAIRTDCLRELGVWVKKFPEKYVSTSYLNYFVRGTNDPDGRARLETVKALQGLYSNSTSASNTGSFTARLAPRLIQMATLDVETPVRTNAISVITLIDKAGALEDDEEEQRQKVARLIFDQEPRIRNAAAAFVEGLWEEKKEELEKEFEALRPAKKKRAGNLKSIDMDTRLQWKALASLLVSTSESLDKPDEEAGSSKHTGTLIPASTSNSLTRAAAATEALSNHMELLDDWNALVNYLLLDHSTNDQDMWLLNDKEEDFLLEMLIACIKEEEEDEDEQKTKALLQVLPKLFTKHQADVNRIVGVLAIPEHMNLAVYLEAQKTAAYQTLWDDVTKQFLQHTDQAVLTAAMQAINTLNANESMATINAQKLGELEEALFTSLRDVVNGEDVPSMTIDEDQVTAIEATLLRISLLARSRDVSGAMEDEEGGQSAGWTIVSAFAGRGSLGYKEESTLVQQALQIVFLHLTWLYKRFTEADLDDQDKVRLLRTRRNEAVELFESFAVAARANPADDVRRQAFLAYINLFMLFHKRNEAVAPAAKVCALEMALDKQSRLGGAFQNAVERYASDLREEESDDEDEDDEPSLEEAQREFQFLQLVSVFVAAVRCGVLDVEQAKEPLMHYGRFGTTYDAVVKKLVDVLRDEGIYNNEATTVQHVISEALQNSFSIFLEEDDDDPDATNALARTVAQSFVVHGTHFTILRQIRSDEVCDLHFANIDWIFKKFAALVKQQSQAKDSDGKRRAAGKRNQLLSYFKPLSHLVGPISGSDALRIRAHLEEAVDKCGAPELARNSAPYRNYEKRLVGAASKDAALKIRGGPSKSRKSAAVVDGSDVEDDDVTPTGTPAPPAASTPAANGGMDGHGDMSMDEDDAATPTKTSTATANGKRPHPDSESLPDIDLDMSAQIDLEFDALPEGEGGGDGATDGGEGGDEPNAKRRKV